MTYFHEKLFLPPFMTDRTILKTLQDSLTGIGGSALAVISATQEQVEWWARTFGWVLGCVVSILTIYRLLTRKTV